MSQVVINKLVHGGQGLAVLPDGKKIFVWNALPGEEVEVELFKSKRSHSEGLATKILIPSSYRIEPAEPEIYLATSPWQIMDFDFENEQKVLIVRETFDREGVNLPDFEIVAGGWEYGYRNKMEFSFYGDDNGLHYAFYNRGTHQKQIVSGSALALPAINQAAQDLLGELRKISIRAGDMKSVILRAQQNDVVVAALFTKLDKFPDINLTDSLKGLRIYHSNPKSPASIPTKLLKTYGDDQLSDKILGVGLKYDVTGFFQVNLPVFELAAKQIKQWVGDTQNALDFYSGVGSIGIPVGAKTLIEVDESNVEMARTNTVGLDIKIVQASSEKALEHIVSGATIIVDPPRAGLHKDVVTRILDQKPSQICYLSCNPATQARDVKLLIEGGYKLVEFTAYNFFPKTPHVESLALLSA